MKIAKPLVKEKYLIIFGSTQLVKLLFINRFLTKRYRIKDEQKFSATKSLRLGTLKF